MTRIMNFVYYHIAHMVWLFGFIEMAIIFGAIGCSSNPRYVEGTNISLGAYLPLDGQLMGIEVVNYLNGCSVRTSSNQAFTVSRTYCSTNSWGWGMVNSTESSTTTVNVK